MDAIEAIMTRRSIREYGDEPINKEDLNTILNCARLAPSANNRQPWKFIVVNEKNKLEKLGDYCTYGKFIKKAQVCIVVVGDKNNSRVVEDCSAATENILLSAHALGYGGCWVAGVNKPYEADVLKLLNVGGERLISLIPIGRPAVEREVRDKKSIEEVVCWP